MTSALIKWTRTDDEYTATLYVDGERVDDASFQDCEVTPADYFESYAYVEWALSEHHHLDLSSVDVEGCW